MFLQRRDLNKYIYLEEIVDICTRYTLALKHGSTRIHKFVALCYRTSASMVTPNLLLFVSDKVYAHNGEVQGKCKVAIVL